MDFMYEIRYNRQDVSCGISYPVKITFDRFELIRQENTYFDNIIINSRF